MRFQRSRRQGLHTQCECKFNFTLLAIHIHVCMTYEDDVAGGGEGKR